MAFTVAYIAELVNHLFDALKAVWVAFCVVGGVVSVEVTIANHGGVELGAEWFDGRELGVVDLSSVGSPACSTDVANVGFDVL